jgi:hypothetical protein
MSAAQNPGGESVHIRNDEAVLQDTEAGEAAAIVTPPKKGRKAGAKGFPIAEKTQLVEVVAEYKPKGSNTWNLVTEAMHTYIDDDPSITWLKREGDSYKKQFMGFTRMMKPTGSATIPPHVLRAKRVWKDICQELAISIYTGDTEEDEEEEDQDGKGEEAFAENSPEIPTVVRTKRPRVEAATGSATSRRRMKVDDALTAIVTSLNRPDNSTNNREIGELKTQMSEMLAMLVTLRNTLTSNPSA